MATHRTACQLCSSKGVSGCSSDLRPQWHNSWTSINAIEEPEYSEPSNPEPAPPGPGTNESVINESHAGREPTAEGMVLSELSEVVDAFDEARETGERVKIDCITDWSASLSTEDASVTVQGPGIETATIDGYPQQVSVVAQKQDDSYEPLTVEIYVDGSLVSEQTTTAEYGVVRLTVQP